MTDTFHQSTELADLAAALAKAQAKIEHASKSANNPHFQKKYADLPAIYDASRQALSDNGLSVVQMTVFDPNGAINLVTTLLHSSGQWMKSWYPIRPIKNDPQGLGSAMTYARRYSYSALVGVASIDEDDDGNAGSGVVPNPPRSEPLPMPAFSGFPALETFRTALRVEFTKAKTEDELKVVAAKHKDKLDEMANSPEGSEQAAANALRADYADALKILKAADAGKPKPPTVDDVLNGDEIRY